MKVPAAYMLTCASVPNTPASGPEVCSVARSPRHEVDPSEVGRIDAHGVRIEDQIGELARPVLIVGRRGVDVGGRVGLHGRRQRRLCRRRGRRGAAARARIPLTGWSRGQGTGRCSCPSAFLLPDAIHFFCRLRGAAETAGHPAVRCGASRRCERGHGGGADSALPGRPHASGCDGRCAQSLASRTSTRQNSAPAGSHRAPVLVFWTVGTLADLPAFGPHQPPPRRRTIHGCGPAPESHRLPLAGSTATSICLPAYGTTACLSGLPLIFECYAVS